MFSQTHRLFFFPFRSPHFPLLPHAPKKKNRCTSHSPYTPPNRSSPFPPSCYYPILHRSSSPFLLWEEEGKGSNPASAAASSKMRVGGGRITFNIFFKSWMYQKSLFLTISLIVKLKAKKNTVLTELSIVVEFYFCHPVTCVWSSFLFPPLPSFAC